MSNYEYAQATDETLAQWEQDAYDRMEDEWESRQVLWAERGGYAAGLGRPA